MQTPWSERGEVWLIPKHKGELKETVSYITKKCFANVMVISPLECDNNITQPQNGSYKIQIFEEW